MAEQETTFTDDQDGEGPSSPFASLTVTQAEVATSARIIANGQYSLHIEHPINMCILFATPLIG